MSDVKTMTATEAEKIFLLLPKQNPTIDELSQIPAALWAKPMSANDAMHHSGLSWLAYQGKLELAPTPILLSIGKDAWLQRADDHDPGSSAAFQGIINNQIQYVPDSIIRAIPLSDWTRVVRKKLSLIALVAENKTLESVFVPQHFVGRVNELDQLWEAIPAAHKATAEKLYQRVKSEANLLGVTESVGTGLSLDTLFGMPENPKPQSVPAAVLVTTIPANDLQNAWRILQERMAQAEQSRDQLAAKLSGTEKEKARLEGAYRDASGEIDKKKKLLVEKDDIARLLQKRADDLSDQLKKLSSKAQKGDGHGRTPAYICLAGAVVSTAVTAFSFFSTPPAQPLFPDKLQTVSGEQIQLPALQRKEADRFQAVFTHAAAAMSSQKDLKKFADALNDKNVQFLQRDQERFYAFDETSGQAFDVVGLHVQPLVGKDSKLLVSICYNTKTGPFATPMTAGKLETCLMGNNPNFERITVYIPVKDFVDPVANKQNLVLAFAIANHQLQKARPEEKVRTDLSTRFVAGAREVEILSKAVPHAALKIRQQMDVEMGREQISKALNPSIENIEKALPKFGKHSAFAQIGTSMTYLMHDQLPQRAFTPLGIQVQRLNVGEDNLQVTLCFKATAENVTGTFGMNELTKCAQGIGGPHVGSLSATMRVKNFTDDSANANAIRHGLEQVALGLKRMPGPAPH